MKTAAQRFFYWAPRVLCLLFAAFISMFALDVFEEHAGFWQTARALLMHLVPTFALLLVLALCWRWEWVGVILFPALGLFYIFSFWGKFPWGTYAIISGPLFMLGFLFFLSWLQRKPREATDRMRATP